MLLNNLFIEFGLLVLSTNVLLEIVCDNSGPVVYTTENFDENLGTSHHFVKFYAPWCGHCKRLSPTWEDLANKFNSEGTSDDKVVIAKVDCTVDTSICAEQDVAAYPTLKFYKKGSNSGTKYRGSRDLKSLSDFIHSSLELVKENTENTDSNIKPEVPSVDKGLQELNDEIFDKFIKKGQHFVKFYAPWCGHCQKLAPTWSDLADSFKHDVTVHISKIDCTENRKTCNQLEVKGYPTLLWFKDGKKIEKYQGSRTHEDLKNFVARMKQSTIEQKEDVTPHIEIEKTDSVVELTSNNFHDVIKKDVVFVKFFAPWCGHCKALAPTWDKLASKFVTNSEIWIAKVDCTVQRELCQKNKVEGYPTLVVFSRGKFIEEYNGDRSLEAMHSFVENHIPKHDEL